MSKTIALISSAAFIAGAALISARGLSSTEVDLPWQEASCRPAVFRGGDGGLTARIDEQDIFVRIALLDPHRGTQAGRRFVYDTAGRATHAELTWEFVLDNLYGPRFAGQTDRMLARLSKQTRGVKVDFGASPNCTDTLNLSKAAKTILYPKGRN